ncbi:MAG TPA: NrfD/PsrC family molybdoenzyme membrane anchor subunit [Streptosporangiaceae bacterium]|nr:NrfD/PsrC family molybdoenzyme membrane anchor subunit [Streptosporangiaceae bacterium]
MTEQQQVPEAVFGSYYGRPVIKVTKWKEPHLPAYLFLGEMSGASAVVAALAAATRRPSLARAARLASAASAAAGAGFLTAELGRPERFLNMLRVFKPTSPMSMGAWVLAAHSGLVSAAAASEVTGLAPKLAEAAGEAAALTGPVLATYPAALLADTAVPAWHSAHRELALLFAGGALTSAAAAGLLAAALPGSTADREPLRRLAVAGVALESVAGYGLEHMADDAARPYREGPGGQALRAARAMTLAGGACALAARRSRGMAVLSAGLLAGGGLAAKFAVLRAGVASARDPRYVVAGQRGRTQPGSRKSR